MAAIWNGAGEILQLIKDGDDVLQSLSKCLSTLVPNGLLDSGADKKVALSSLKMHIHPRSTSLLRVPRFKND